MGTWACACTFVVTCAVIGSGCDPTKYDDFKYDPSIAHGGGAGGGGQGGTSGGAGGEGGAAPASCADTYGPGWYACGPNCYNTSTSICCIDTGGTCDIGLECASWNGEGACVQPGSGPICDSGWATTPTECAECLSNSCCSEFTQCAAESLCSGCAVSGGAESYCADDTTYQSAMTCVVTYCISQCSD